MNWTKEAYQLFRRLKKHATKQIIVKIVGVIKVKHSMSPERNIMIFFCYRNKFMSRSPSCQTLEIQNFTVVCVSFTLGTKTQSSLVLQWHTWQVLQALK